MEAGGGWSDRGGRIVGHLLSWGVGENPTASLEGAPSNGSFVTIIDRLSVLDMIKTPSK